MLYEELISKLSDGNIKAIELIDYAIESNLTFSWHPLGFAVCKICELGDITMRLHIWPTDGGRPQNPNWKIHNHLFDLNSWVLQGRIYDTEYTLIDSGVKYRLYNVAYTTNGSIMSRTNSTIDINIFAKKTIAEGDSYQIKSGFFHKSEACPNNIAVTVVEANKTNMTTPQVVGDLEGCNAYQYERMVLSTDEVMFLRASILAVTNN
ncbi:hypothetical protein ACMU9X_001348 [Yersinia enterocolitica]|nr:hypothetical protein [Yersinia enterocolitica]HEN3335214.1 hypothetical protein [Yersinia enterocolitica]